MAHQQPYWPWCVQRGATRTTKLAVDQTNFGDGYIERVTRGLNPARPTWSIEVPFVGLAQLAEYEAFLKANALRGFYWTPPDSIEDVFVVTDEWSPTIVDKSSANGIVGVLRVSFTQMFNPQPITAVP